MNVTDENDLNIVFRYSNNLYIPLMDLVSFLVELH